MLYDKINTIQCKFSPINEKMNSIQRTFSPNQSYLTFFKIIIHQLNLDKLNNMINLHSITLKQFYNITDKYE